MKLKIKDKKIQAKMRDQLREAIETFGEELGNDDVVSPAAKQLMMLNKDDEDLDEKKRYFFVL